MQLTGLQKETACLLRQNAFASTNPSLRPSHFGWGRTMQMASQTGSPDILRRGDAGRTHTREILQAVIALAPTMPVDAAKDCAAPNAGNAR
jgi:hypothetical protein